MKQQALWFTASGDAKWIAKNNYKHLPWTIGECECRAKSTMVIFFRVMMSFKLHWRISFPKIYCVVLSWNLQLFKGSRKMCIYSYADKTNNPSMLMTANSRYRKCKHHAFLQFFWMTEKVHNKIFVTRHPSGIYRSWHVSKLYGSLYLKALFAFF